MKIVAISDTHIVPKGQASRGIDTAERLRMALADLAENHGDAVFCVLCGDLADHGDPDAYAHLAELLDGFPLPLKFMIGNHDHRANFIAAFPDAPLDSNGFVQSVADAEAGRFIFCDTYEAGRVDGRMCADRLTWLDERLAERRDRPAYVFFHHPAWRNHGHTDAIRLTDAGKLAGILKKYDHVRHLFAGHTHRISSGVWNGTPFATLGATHYNNGMPVVGPNAWAGRYHTPGYSTVILIDDDQVVVHPNEFLHANEELDGSQFDPVALRKLLDAGGDLSVLQGHGD